LVLICILFNQYVGTGGAQGDTYYTEFGRKVRLWLLAPECLGFFFFIVAVVFMPMGQQIGEGLKIISPPLKGYTINILGSLVGVLAFTVISLLELGPWWWFAVTMFGLLWFVRQDKFWRNLNTTIGVLAIITVWLAGEMYYWTPYSKLAMHPMVEKGNGKWAVGDEMVRLKEVPALRRTLGFNMTVNDDFYQRTMDMSPFSVQIHSNIIGIAEHYNLPFSIRDFSYNDVLIVGAGTGDDVAAALRGGAKHVDAVEIDPGILRLGQIAHPEQPYSDPRVRVCVDDARSFFNRTDRKYDLIVFGFLDAHRLFSSMSSVRLDSFVYTVESFQETRSLLKKDGIVVVQHALGKPYMNMKMYRMLTDAFGAKPYYTENLIGEGTFFAGPGVNKFIASQETADVPAVDPATDDWPFFYLDGHILPPEYRLALEIMALIALVCLLVASQGKMQTVNGHFFFLGAAFLLIETVSVTRLAMLFGSTWVVNSIVFSAILLVVLFANLWTNRITSLNIHLFYVLLATSVAMNFVFPIHLLLRYALAMRLFASMILMASPIFFAAVIFARSYMQTPNVDLAFASNLLGAVIGGLIEYSSLVIGFRHLFLISLGIYALSYVALFLPSRKVAAVCP